MNVLRDWYENRDESGRFAQEPCAECGYPDGQHDCPGMTSDTVLALTGVISPNVRIVPAAHKALSTAWHDVEVQLGRISSAAYVLSKTEDPEKAQLLGDALTDHLNELDSRVTHLKQTWKKESEK